MFDFPQFEALFWILFDSAIKGLLLLALVGAIAMAMRRASAAALHLVWFLALSALICLPALSALLPEWRIEMLPSSFGPPAYSEDVIEPARQLAHLAVAGARFCCQVVGGWGHRAAHR